MKVGITHGDLNGVNYELLLKIFEDNSLTELCTPVIYGSPRVAAWYKKTLDLPGFQCNVIESADNIRQKEINMINVLGVTEPEITPGLSSEEAGKSAKIALQRAVADLRAGKIDVIVTSPINKNNIQSEDFSYPGHTEFLEAEFGDEENKSLMIMVSDRLKVALVTTHLPLKEVAGNINEDVILEKLRIFNRSLALDFSLPHPKIAVLSLNPHSGDNGLLGDEEKNIIEPALEKAREEGIFAYGPYSADGFFGSANYLKFDGVLAMYHDQGLIPFKTIAMEKGVNFTAGLPIVRTSPDHGTGYDIAGKNQATVGSLREAIYWAIDIYRNRKRNLEAKSNPLKKYYNPVPKNRE